MLVKSSLVLTVMLVIAVTFGGMVQAASSVPDIVYQKNIKSSAKEFNVQITRPEGDESTFKKSYVICGNTSIKDMHVELAIEEGGRWVPFYDVDGYSGWDIEESGIFMKEVVLPKVDVNKIRIAAYRNSDADNLVLNRSLQVNNYSITVLSPMMTAKIKTNSENIADIMKLMKDCFATR
ncbi:MAG TPA: hypothetical protein VF941_20350 [Clostridia bacterium]